MRQTPAASGAADASGAVADSSRPLRLFYALWPDDAARAALLRLQTAVSGRLTIYDNLHLTLVFLGQQPVASLSALQEILAGLPKPESDMVLTLDRFGHFAKSRIAWAGMHAVPDALWMLQRHLVTELERRNIPADTQSRFRPHVTLARNAAAPAEKTFEPVHWRADHACLVASSTEPGGVRYRIIGSKRL